MKSRLKCKRTQKFAWYCAQDYCTFTCFSLNMHKPNKKIHLDKYFVCLQNMKGTSCLRCIHSSNSFIYQVVKQDVVVAVAVMVVASDDYEYVNISLYQKKQLS